MVAVTDADTRILWTYGVPGDAPQGRDGPLVRRPRASVGTNALDLAGRSDRAATGLRAEHYAPIVHNWGCWAAGARPGHRRAARRDRPVDHLDPPTRSACHRRVMARLIENAMPQSADTGSFASRPAAGPLAGADPAGPRRPASTASGCPAHPPADRDLALLALAPRGRLALEHLEPCCRRQGRSHARDARGGGLAPAQRRRGTARVRWLAAAACPVRRRARLRRWLSPAPARRRWPALADYVAVAVREALRARPAARGGHALHVAGADDTEVMVGRVAALGDVRHPARARARAGWRPHAAERPASGPHQPLTNLRRLVSATSHDHVRTKVPRGVLMTKIEVTVDGTEVRRRRRTAHAARPLPSRTSRQDRHRGGL